MKYTKEQAEIYLNNLYLRFGNEYFHFFNTDKAEALKALSALPLYRQADYLTEFKRFYRWNSPSDKSSIITCK